MAEDHVVVDVEIATPIEELPGGWEATDQVGVAVAVVYEHRGDRFRVYGPGEVQKLQDRLCRARRVTGFNHWDFDLPVIWGAKRSEWRATRSGGDGRWASLREGLAPQCDDLLRRIWESAGLDPETFTDGHQGFGLNAVCEATLGVGKIGHGGDAPRWYREGQVQRVVNYCLDDVTLTRDLAAFIDRYGHIVHPKTLKPLRIVPGPFVALKW